MVIQSVLFQMIEEPVHISALPVHPLFHRKAGEPGDKQSREANNTPTCIPSVVPYQDDDQSLDCNVVLTGSISVGLPSEGSVTGVNV